MKTFSCKVRIRGNVLDEVRKSRVSSAEVTALKSLHGDDAVSEIVELPEEQWLTGEGGSSWREQDERNRLIMIYGEPAVIRIFGAQTAKIGAEIGDTAPARSRRNAVPPDPLAA